MTRIKHLLLLICIAGCFTACQKKEENFDFEAQFRTDTTAIRKYINDKKLVMTKDASGVFYQIIEPGTGTVKYNDKTEVNVEYEGKVLDGAVFDATKNGPISLPLGGVIKGWQIAIPFIQKGGAIRMIIPSFYGYGNRQGLPFPPNSILDFKVTLVDVH